MSDARQALRSAQAAGAAEYSPAILGAAEQALIEAEEALTEHRYRHAREHARRARDHALQARIEALDATRLVTD